MSLRLAMSFTHLHVHSHYSLLDGLPQIKPLVKAAKERGFSALALTDSGAMYGAMEFYETCLAEGVKPIIGFEAYITEQFFPLILLAENYAGYKNLMKLCSEAHTRGFWNDRPRLDKETLAQYHEHIIALSGDIRGEVPHCLKEGKLAEAKQAAAIYQEIFGANNFYLELQDHPAIPGQMEVNTKMIQLARDTGIPLVVTRDVHYLNREDAEAQDTLTCIREGWKVEEMKREDYRQGDRSLNTAEDIESRFRHVREAIENTGEIAERVKIEIKLNQWHFARIVLPAGRTADQVLREQTFASVGKYLPLTSETEGRLNYELSIIEKKGYAPYFLCVADYVQYAKAHGIVETTRGSAAGSLVSYVLGITTVDPIRFKLPFERFLNPYRPSPPDIDTDFADDRREEMIAYVTQKYGPDKVAQIITFGTMAARASVRDVGRALGLAYSFCDQVAKLIPFGAQGFPMTILRALGEEPDLKKLYATNSDVRRLLDLAQKVEGCARHTSIHAAGVVISPTPLTDFTPIQHEVGGKRLITQYEMHAVEAAGLLKMDFLGIRNLSILGKAVEIVAKTVGEQVDIYSLPLDDQATFAMLTRGETMGTFQLGGSGMTRWLKELKPTTVDDIMAMVALFRPGPMESIPEYIRRKHNPDLIIYLDPRMKKHLEASFGLLVYQDDVLLTAIELAGYNWEEADKFRKAIGKKIPAEMEKQKIKFAQGCRTHGRLSEDQIKTLWHLIEPFAAYGFNKAHAASYGMIAYQTAYMKAHYPVQYMTAVLQAEAGDIDKVAAIVHECGRIGIEVLPPDVNESFRNFAIPSTSPPGGAVQGRGVVPNRIRFGLSAIKNVGEHICEVVYAERKEHGAYKSLEDFLARIQDKDLNKKSVESLVQAGALDSFGHDRGVLLANIDAILYFSKQAKDKSLTHQHSLFAGTSIALESIVTMKPAAAATLEQKLAWEKNLLGLYVSSHPFAYFQEEMVSVLTLSSQIAEYPRGEWVVAGGVVEEIKKKLTKKGSMMLFVTIADRSGSVELLVFPKTYEQTQSLWRLGGLVCVVGKTPREEGDNKIFVENVYVLNKDNVQEIAQQVSMGNEEMKKPVLVPLSHHEVSQVEGLGNEVNSVTLRLTKDELKQHTQPLKQIFEKFPGKHQVYLDIGGNLIRTQTKVDGKSGIRAELEDLIGEGKVVID